MIREFTSKSHDLEAESQYQDWIEQHRTNGFVLNLFGGTTAQYNIIHRCSCWVLHRDKDEGARTRVPKLCSTELEELEEAATNKLGSNALWRHCKICKPDGDASPAEGSEVRPSDKPTSVEESPGKAPAAKEGDIWVAGSPAVWLSRGEADWKEAVGQAVSEWKESSPEWLDMTFCLSPNNLYSRDIDNMITPVLEALRDAQVIERGFNRVGTVTSRKVSAASDADEGLMLNQSTTLPEDVERSDVLIETALASKDEGTIKRTLYRRSAELYWSCPHLAFPPQQPLSLHIKVDIADPGPRKSIKDMLKPCIDGLEPIMSRPDGLQPFTLSQLDAGEWRTLAPQDEMVVDLRMDVRGGPQDRVSVVISPSTSS